MSSPILAIESAIAGGSIAIIVDGKIIASWSGDTGVSKAEDLLPTIAGLLKDQELQLKDLKLIVVSVGPGSFTGIRIGISTAMGLSDSTGIETVGISSLAAIAKNSNARTAIVPVGKHDIAWQTFSENGESDISIGSFEELLAAKPDEPIFHHTIFAERRDAITENFGEVKICKNPAIEIGRFAITFPEYRLPLEPLYVQNPRYVSAF